MLFKVFNFNGSCNKQLLGHFKTHSEVLSYTYSHTKENSSITCLLKFVVEIEILLRTEFVVTFNNSCFTRMYFSHGYLVPEVLESPQPIKTGSFLTYVLGGITFDENWLTLPLFQMLLFMV